ncbi:MAG: ABC transporter ATP-binding protein [Firmicutes bacterium]|nr:ABC transporter ATP-binding protein [Bacillota bacterium]MCL5038259.1 ABC transporter ATP-binding protein [Bacillota bacterium]
MPILECHNLSRSFGGLRALSDLSFSLEEGEILALIGPNGAGKTTVFNCITGVYPPSAGLIRFGSQVINGLPTHEVARKGLARTFQITRLFRRLTLLENLMVAQYPFSELPLWQTLLDFRKTTALERKLAAQAQEILEFVGLGKRAGEKAENLPLGDQKRLELGIALATRPSLLLLDEPAAGMNPTETEEMVRLIRKARESGVTVLLIEHDMKLVMGLSERILVLNQGRKIAEGTPREISNNPLVIEAYLGHGGMGGKKEGGHAET